jgi:hypothetical protein
MASGVSEGRNQPPTLVRGLRHDPHHAPELLLLHAVPQLSPQVGRWHASLLRRHPQTDVDKLSAKLIRRATAQARFDGAVSGSSFYVGMPPAIASLYCRQVMTVLQIAALFGYDPTDPARLVDLLVIQGRHPHAEAASAALRTAGATAPGADGHHVPNAFTAMRHALGHVPGMVGMRFNAFRTGGPFNAMLSVAKVASYLVPVLGMPAWAIDQARVTRKLGSDAVAFYAARTGPDPAFGVVLPPPLKPRTRQLFTAGVVALGVLLAILAAVVRVGALAERWTVLVFAELFLVVTVGRLLWITRAGR